MTQEDENGGFIESLSRRGMVEILVMEPGSERVEKGVTTINRDTLERGRSEETRGIRVRTSMKISSLS